jgi:Zn ribbon nucleic-acid-binding protein
MATHWGWFWRIKKNHIARTLCSKLTSIDSFKLFKNGPTSGFKIQPLDIDATPTINCLKITYRNRREHSYVIPIERLSCNYGGFRYYFKCPLCKRRMRILYFAEKSIFLCRKCLNLGYESQRLRPTKRYEYMSKKIKKSINDKGGVFDRYKKPPHMHTKRHEALHDKEFDYKEKSIQALEKDMLDWFGLVIKL